MSIFNFSSINNKKYFLLSLNLNLIIILYGLFWVINYFNDPYTLDTHAFTQNAEVLKWSKQAIPAVISNPVQNEAVIFTGKGLEHFLTANNQAGLDTFFALGGTVKINSMGEPIIKDTRMIHGHPAWLIEMPVSAIYKNSNLKSEIIKKNYLVKLLVLDQDKETGMVYPENLKIQQIAVGT